MCKLPPKGTVRGNIKHYLYESRDLFAGRVLEIGSRRHNAEAWWMDNRDIRSDLFWTGIDMQSGLGVDKVMDAENMSFDDKSYNTAICSEVLEHTKNPRSVISEIYRVLQDGCYAFFTIPFGFHIHAFPDDYWRITPSCLKMILGEVGFNEIEVDTIGETILTLDDHGDGSVEKSLPMHVVGRAIK